MGRYSNPILAGCHPDPSLCRVGDTFYLVTSTFEYLPGLPLHASRNLVDWTPIGHAIERPGQLDLAGLPSSRGLFAPTIRHNGERFFVVCTVVGPDDGSWSGRTGHFVVTAIDAARPWSDPLWIDGVDGIDPSLTFDADRVWLTFTRAASEPSWPGQTEVRLVELEPSTLQPRGAAVTIWQGALIGSVWAEGPHILPRPGGGWMLLAAEGGTSREHAVCVAYADTIAGPYLGDPGNPRLSHRDLGHSTAIAAVGHADLVDDADGRTWATVLATELTDGADDLLGRRTYLVPVQWQDARPVFAPGEGRVRSVVDAEGVPDQAPAVAEFADDFATDALDLGWTGVGRHPSAFASVDAPGRLLLAAGAEPASTGPQSFLGRRLPARDTDAEVALTVPPGSARGGLLLRTSERAHVELALDGEGVLRCVLTGDGERRVLAERGGHGARVVLGLAVRGRRGTATVDGEPLVDIDLSALVPDAGGGFVGAWVGPVAIGSSGAVEVARATVAVRC